MAVPQSNGAAPVPAKAKSLSQKRRDKKKAQAKKPKEQPVEPPPKVDEPVSPWATDRMSRPNPKGAPAWQHSLAVWQHTRHVCGGHAIHPPHHLLALSPQIPTMDQWIRLQWCEQRPELTVLD